MDIQSLRNTIIQKRAVVGIVGLGYIGLPLGIAFAKKGFRVYGIDIASDRVESIRRKRSYILDVTDGELAEAVSSGKLSATTDFQVVRKLDAVLICVPTPLNKAKEPDVSYIMHAVTKIKKYLRRGQIIVLESTTYPGTTEEIMLPILEEGRFKEGRDFFLAFSPERVDPSNPVYKTYNTPKLIGGISRRSTEIARLLYAQVIERVIPVSSSQVAEMAKLLENTFRIVNIGLVNEIMLMCDRLGIDVWEVIEAAKTKPYGFMPFYPGPGVGGHCIPVDPLYLSWRARGHGFEARFIDLASHVNSLMPHYVIEKVTNGLNSSGKAIKGSKVLIMGVTYKKDVKDLRESPALEIITLLQKRGARISYYDPYIPYLKINGINLKRMAFSRHSFRAQDCVIVITDHAGIDYELVVRHAKLIVDTRNALRRITGKSLRKKIVKL